MRQGLLTFLGLAVWGLFLWFTWFLDGFIGFPITFVPVALIDRRVDFGDGALQLIAAVFRVVQRIIFATTYYRWI